MNIILLIISSVLAITIAILFYRIRKLRILLDDEHSKYEDKKDEYDSKDRQFKELLVHANDLQTQLLESKAFVDATSNSLIKEIDSSEKESPNKEDSIKYELDFESKFTRIIEPNNTFKLSNSTNSDLVVSVIKIAIKNT